MGKTVVGARQRHLHGLVTSRERKSGTCSSETWSFEVSAAARVRAGALRPWRVSARPRREGRSSASCTAKLARDDVDSQGGSPAAGVLAVD